MHYLPPFLLEIALIANRRQCIISSTIISRQAATTSSSSSPVRIIRQQVASLSADNTTYIIMPSSSSKSKRKRTTTAEHENQQQQQLLQPWYHKFTQSDPLYTNYMRNEWSHEKQTDNELFEKLCLEGAQAGLSWRTILHKREAYRRAFHEFDIDKVASMTTSDIDNLMMLQQPQSKDHTTSDRSSQEVTVVRHRGKLESVINNAKMIQKLKANGIITTTFSRYLWSFVNNKPILNSWKTINEMPSKTTESEMMSKELKKHGFKFVGPTTCYSLMQSCGFVIDHVVDSEEWVEAEKRLKKRKGGYERR